MEGQKSSPDNCGLKKKKFLERRLYKVWKAKDECKKKKKKKMEAKSSLFLSWNKK